MINIAVLGYGTVGSGVVEVINKNYNSISKRAGQEINVKYVLDLRDFPGDPIQEKIVHDYFHIRVFFYAGQSFPQTQICIIYFFI